MPQQIQSHFLPTLVAPEQLAGGSVVVIDILRATTTITYALAAGAKEVLPCLEVAEAEALAATMPAGSRLTGGERGGLPIDGFDLGNSPDAFVAEQVRGRSIVFTTTNGTRAMMQCRQAAEIAIGAFVNLSAVCRLLADRPVVHLLCAGTRGEITREDVLFAGAVADRLATDDVQFNDQARLAREAWRAALSEVRLPLPLGERRGEGFDAAALAATLLQTQGGRNLQRIGLAGDIEAVAQFDRFDFVPRLDVAAWRITRP